MCRCMFGLLLMTQALPHEMIVMKMMKMFVLCVVTNTPPQFVGSAMRGIALNVLTLTLVGMKLCMLHHNFAMFLHISDLHMLQYTCSSAGTEVPCVGVGRAGVACWVRYLPTLVS